MRRCPWCDRVLKSNWEKIGARCPHCREALYEEPRPPAPAGPEEGSCAVHPANAAVGTCARCGNYLCAVCKTRWRDGTLCPACVGRALEGGEGQPQRKRLQWTHASLALVLGVGSWGLVVLAFILVIAGMGSENFVMVGMGGLLLLFSAVPALIGAGLGASAIRARGGQMIVATIGLLLNGLLLGTLIGLISFRVWNE